MEKGKIWEKYRGNRIPFRAYNVSDFWGFWNEYTVVAIFSTGRFFLRFFYHESEENHTRLNVGRPRKIDRFATREIDLDSRRKRGVEWRMGGGGGWTRRVNVCHSKKKKKRKKISKILQGLDGLRNENPNSCDYCT